MGWSLLIRTNASSATEATSVDKLPGINLGTLAVTSSDKGTEPLTSGKKKSLKPLNSPFGIAKKKHRTTKERGRGSLKDVVILLGRVGFDGVGVSSVNYNGSIKQGHHLGSVGIYVLCVVCNVDLFTK